MGDYFAKGLIRFPSSRIDLLKTTKLNKIIQKPIYRMLYRTVGVCFLWVFFLRKFKANYHAFKHLLLRQLLESYS